MSQPGPWDTPAAAGQPWDTPENGSSTMNASSGGNKEWFGNEGGTGAGSGGNGGWNNNNTSLNDGLFDMPSGTMGPPVGCVSAYQRGRS